MSNTTIYTKREDTIVAMTHKLHEYIAGDDTLVLLSGGSSVPVSVEALSRLSIEDRERITVGMTDERFGTYFHIDSNEKALCEAGLMELEIREFYQILLEENLSFEENIARYNATLHELLSQFSKSIGIFGIGVDNHIAGILPESIAVREEKEMVVGYTAGPYQRITMTFPAILQLQNAFIYAEGEEKREAVESLKNVYTVLDHPNQIVKSLSEYSVFYCLEK